MIDSDIVDYDDHYDHDNDANSIPVYVCLSDIAQVNNSLRRLYADDDSDDDDDDEEEEENND